MISGLELWRAIERAGLDFFTGVPDSTFKSLLVHAEKSDRYVPAVSEDLAVGLAVGAYLGGRSPMVLMQNSGLGNSINGLTSLAALYRIPLLVLIGWRGHDQKDAPEHLLMGRAMPALLASLEIPFDVLEADTAEQDLQRAAARARELRRPVGLILRPGTVGS